MRRARWQETALLLAAMAVGGCGGGGGDGGGGGTTQIDTSYNFTAAGVQPGVDARSSTRGSVSGVLLNASQNPVAGVTVTLYRLVTRASRQAVGSITTVSNSSGRYVFGNVEPGDYRLSAQNQNVDVTVVANANSQSNFSNITSGGGGNPPPAQYKWTVIMFMNADNDLEPYAIQDVNELEALPNNDDVAIVALLDRTRGFDTSNGNWTDTRRFRIRHDDDPSTMTSALSSGEGGQAEILGELDTGDKDTVSDFIEYCMTNYPAERYLLDVWNHGAGWRKRTALDVSPIGRGVLFDDTSDTFVATSEMDEAFAGPARLDIIAFDSSLMQMIEVAYQVRDLTTLVVGSEESPPGEGYPYDQIFESLLTNPDIAPEALAAHIVNRTVDVMGDDNQLTQSALRAALLPNLVNAINSYADLLRTKDSTHHDQIAAARSAAQRYGSGSSLYEGNRDLVDLIIEITARTNDAALASAGTAVRDALNAALVAERHSGSSKADSHGLAIFAPNQSDWTDL
ncbi:MAG: carboxypeptidase regulatory-like domain-containing protein, partial [Armatimonadetes bacterium]|nr:carboxypeptidase regulatory-like domain-containing protein [Armatimonadota bacterium]